MSAGAVHHPVFARVFDRLVQAETHEQREHRRRLVAGLRGRVLEVGAGTGRNLRLYGSEVSEVVAVEPEAYMRRRAAEGAERAHVRVRIVEATAEDLPFPDGAFDAAVCSLVLCTVRDQGRVLAEVRRVLRPGGELRVYEHVRAGPGSPTDRLQQVLDATLWPRLAGGCHTHRDTAAAIEAAGFAWDAFERVTVGPLPLSAPVAPHVLGVARRT